VARSGSVEAIQALASPRELRLSMLLKGNPPIRFTRRGLTRLIEENLCQIQVVIFQKGAPTADVFRDLAS